MSTKFHFLINVFAQGIGRVFTTGVSFLVFVLVARYMGVDQFGQYTYYITFLSLFVVVSEFGMQAVLAKDISQVKNPEEYFGNYLFLKTIFTVITIGIAIITAYYLRKDLFTYLVIGSFALPVLNSRFFEPIYQVFHKPFYSTITSVVYGISFLVCSLMALFISPTFQNLVGAFLLSNVIYTVTAYALAFRLVKPKFNIQLSLLKPMMVLTLPMGVSSLFTIVNSKVDVFMLAKMKSDYAVGMYSVAYRFLDIIVVFAATLTIPLMPIFSRWAVSNRDNLKRNYMKIIELFTVVLVPLAILVPFISKFLLGAVFGEEYVQASGVLNILIWVCVLVFFSLVNSASNLAVNDITHGYWNSALAAVLNIMMNYFWIPKFSYIGSSWATLISEVVLLSISHFFVMKNLGNVFNKEKWLKIIFLIMIFLGCVYIPAQGILKVCIVSLAMIGYVWAILKYQVLNLSFILEMKSKKNE